jgi:hypothetical protein
MLRCEYSWLDMLSNDSVNCSMTLTHQRCLAKICCNLGAVLTVQHVVTKHPGKVRSLCILVNIEFVNINELTPRL